MCGIWSQFFMIKLISWRVGLVGFALPWLGFAFGCLFSKLCKSVCYLSLSLSVLIHPSISISAFLSSKHLHIFYISINFDISIFGCPSPFSKLCKSADFFLFLFLFYKSFCISVSIIHTSVCYLSVISHFFFLS